MSKKSTVLLAALALPGLAPTVALADNPPEATTVSYKQLHYSEKQPGHDRVKVNAPSVRIEAPLGAAWSVDVSGVVDSVSGASPRYYTNMVSGASKMTDERKALDVAVTHYRANSTYTVSASHSAEHDYVSNAFGLNGHWSTADHNTTFNAGIGVSKDDISQTGDPSVDERRNTHEMLIGVTQALSPVDLVQMNYSHSVGKGDFNDHYKGDERPKQRNQDALLVRWNHQIESLDATARTSYRFYTDSWGVQSHTASLEWVQPVSDTLTITPLLRYYTQRAADFYVDPELNGSGQPGLPADFPLIFTADQRLSAFGAVTLGVKFEYALSPTWKTDIKGEYYQQKSSWRLGGQGSPNLAPFSAITIQWGLSHKF